MGITKEQLALGTGASPAQAIKWLDPIQKAMDKYAINRPNRIAAFLANVGVESGGLTAVVENLNYSAVGLAKVWGGRYATNPKAKADDRIPNDLALSIARKPELIANHTYSSRNGNGDVASGDGWRFIGRGLIQLTGRANYAAFAKSSGINVVANPELAETPLVAAMSAAWYFSNNACNEMADRNEISKIVKTINGALPCDANHGTTRLNRYQALRRNLVS